MSNTVRVEYQNIKPYVTQIISNISSVRQDVSTVYAEQLKLGELQNQTLRNITVISEKTDNLLKKQMDSQVLSQAISEIQRLREEWKKKYGHYNLIRNRTLAIVQAPDEGIIDLNIAVEEANRTTLEASEFWLPTALLSLIHWRQLRQELSRRSVQQTLKKGITKPALFFALVHKRESTRKNPRITAIKYWLKSYFTTQSFDALNRETILVVNALANNVFGIEVKKECSDLFLSKIEEYLFKDDENYQKQIDIWYEELYRCNKFILSKEDYHTLRQRSENWNEVEQSISRSRHHKQLFLLFDEVLGSELNHHPNMLVELDNLLKSLIRDFEEEELQHLKELEKYQLIVKNLGDQKASETEFQAKEKLFDEKVDCGKLLVNSFFYPEEFKATKGSRRISISLTKEHLQKALDILNKKYEEEEVKDVLVKIDEWTGASKDGSNEKALITNLEQHIETKRKNAIKRVDIPFKNILIGLGIIFIAWFIGGGFSWLLLLGVLGGGFFIFTAWRKYKAQVNEINTSYAEKMQMETNLLKKLLAEIVDMREDISEHKKYHEQLVHLIDNVNFNSLMYKSSADKKDDYEEAIEEGLITSLPEWDLLPTEKILVKKKKTI